MGKRKQLQKPQIEKQPSSSLWSWILLAIVVIAISAIRARLLSIPLERDEGEYSYAGQLILQGIPPYKLAYNMKLPGIYYAYAMIMAIFGQTVVGIHLGLMVINAASLVLLFFVGKRLFDSTAGIAAAAAYGLLTMNPGVFGPQAHATHFVVLPALGGILLALKYVDNRRLLHLFLSGLLLGLAITMKQQGVFFAMFVMLYVVWNELRIRPLRGLPILARAGVFGGGTVIPIGLIFLMMYAAGVFSKFWFWAIEYASQYVTEKTFSQGLRTFQYTFVQILGYTLPIWIIAAVGLALLWADKKSRRRGVFVTTFFVFAFLTICPGYYFREHYYVTWMPAVALLAGVCMSAGANLLRRTRLPSEVAVAIPAVLVTLAIVLTVAGNADFLLRLPPESASRRMYGGCPWVESQVIAKYIREHSSPNDRIAVLGSEPQIYFYSQRKSATGFIYVYSLMEPQPFALKMQKEMTQEVEKAKPRFIVFVKLMTSWVLRPDSNLWILGWMNKYFKDYEVVGIVQTVKVGPGPDDMATDYVWGSNVSTYKPDMNNCIFVLERKSR